MPEPLYALTAEQVAILRQITSAWQRGELRIQPGAGITPIEQGVKPLIRFSVASSTVAGSTSFLATIIEQYGPGIKTSTAADVTIRSFLPSASTGYGGYALWEGTGRQYTHIGTHTRYRGQLQGALATTDASKTVDNLILISGLHWNISSLTAYNVAGWSGSDNNACWVEWCQGANRWEMYQVKC